MSALPSLAAAQAASSAELEHQSVALLPAHEAMALNTAREAMALNTAREAMVLVAASASESARWRGEATAAVHSRRATEEVANEKARRAAAEVARWKAEAEAAQQAVARAEVQAGMTPGGANQEANPRRLSDYAAGLPNLPLLPSLWLETPQYKPRTAGRMALDMAPPAAATALDSLPPYQAPYWAHRAPAAPSSRTVEARSAYTGLGAPYGADVLSAEAVAREVMRSIDLAAEQLNQAEMRANACVGFATPTPPSAAAQLLPVRSAGGEAAAPDAHRDAPSSTPCISRCISRAPPSPDLNGFTPNAAAGWNARPAAERLDDELMRIDNEIAKLQQALQTASTTEVA